MDIRGAIPTAGLDDGVLTVEAGVITGVSAVFGPAPPPAGVLPVSYTHLTLPTTERV